MMLDKKAFYDALKPFTNKHHPIMVHVRIKDHFEIYFEWSSRKPNGDFNPLMYAQLIDTRISGFKKYVVPDLLIDCLKVGITTDYKLYKHLDLWITDALTKKEAVS